MVKDCTIINCFSLKIIGFIFALWMANFLKYSWVDKHSTFKLLQEWILCNQISRAFLKMGSDCIPEAKGLSSLTPGMMCMIPGLLCPPSLCKEQGFQNHSSDLQGQRSPVKIFLVTVGVIWIIVQGALKILWNNRENNYFNKL